MIYSQEDHLAKNRRTNLYICHRFHLPRSFCTGIETRKEILLKAVAQFTRVKSSWYAWYTIKGHFTAWLRSLQSLLPTYSSKLTALGTSTKSALYLVFPRGTDTVSLSEVSQCTMGITHALATTRKTEVPRLAAITLSTSYVIDTDAFAGHEVTLRID